MLVTVPCPEPVALPRERMEQAVTRAIAEAESDRIRGKALTPFLLRRVAELTGGESRTANLALLRQNAGIAAEVYLGSSGMKAQMKYADRRMAPAAVIVGEDELQAGTVTIKDLDLGRELAKGIAEHSAWRAERPGQVTVPRAELVAAVRRIVEGGA